MEGGFEILLSQGPFAILALVLYYRNRSFLDRYDDAMKRYIEDLKSSHQAHVQSLEKLLK